MYRFKLSRENKSHFLLIEKKFVICFMGGKLHLFDHRFYIFLRIDFNLFSLAL